MITKSIDSLNPTGTKKKIELDKLNIVDKIISVFYCF